MVRATGLYPVDRSSILLPSTSNKALIAQRKSTVVAPTEDGSSILQALEEYFSHVLPLEASASLRFYTHLTV